ncbi:Diacylglycerol kinase family enzyme [Brevibacterium sandarakinum]|uniref:Diacylglycerol kinase family enzyme n=1 Tax=Brevibacterium sandarakinum TaxID=629680 RepID=A0A1H1L8G3_BRESA|nr:diacylglycerol kinase family protein [Brevibacterium sandarakinum]SDR70786.1 Diacylglycerol kinase family enzyme [Brevibacterium sandarakinum]
MKVGILVNPRHRRTSRVHTHLVEILKRGQIPYRSTTTTRTWPGAEQSSRLIDWGADVVVVLGGDGTLRAIAPVLADAKVPVLIVPTGTANVLSRHMGIRSAEHALLLAESFLESDPVSHQDVAVNEADCYTAEGHRREHFLSLAGVGGDARAVGGRTRLPAPFNQGIVGYAYGAGRALFAPLTNARINAAEFDGDTKTRVWSVMASKTARPAGPIPVFDHAEVTAEEFEFLAVELATTTPRDRLGEWARIGWDCLNRHPGANPAMHYWRGREAAISLDAPAPVQLDGDSIGDCSGLDLRAGTTSLTLLAPN